MKCDERRTAALYVFQQLADKCTEKGITRDKHSRNESKLYRFDSKRVRKTRLFATKKKS